jgi:hypothetical protein
MTRICDDFFSSSKLMCKACDISLSISICQVLCDKLLCGARNLFRARPFHRTQRGIIIRRSIDHFRIGCGTSGKADF